MHWEKITLVGVGLLGGSLGLALRRNSLAGTVAGYVRRPASIAECLSREVVTHATTDLAEAVQNAGLVILCTPVEQMEALTRQFLPALKPGAIVTDVGSVKRPVVTTLEPLVTTARAHFVGSHPMAGAEKTGVNAAAASLFDGAICAITPTPDSNPGAVSQLDTFWRSVGATPLLLTPALHDQLVARSSHLPHLAAAALVNTVLNPSLSPEQARLCGPGFRDTTRIASGSPEMWRDICLSNRDHLAPLLETLILHLQEFREALAKNDAGRIETLLQSAKQHRDHWLGR